jgi:hypothetical protein
MLCWPYGSELDLWGFHFSRPNLRLLSLRPDDLLTILKMALSIGFRNSVSLLSAIQATRLLTFASVGLSPTEHSSLSWTHFRTAGFPQYGFKAGLSDEAFPADWFAIVLRALPAVTVYPLLCVGDDALVCPSVRAVPAALPQGPSLRSGLGCPGPSSLNRPHPPHSRAHPDFTDSRVL